MSDFAKMLEVSRNSPPVVETPPYIHGGTAVGATLTCGPGGWTGEPTAYAYQWKRDAATNLTTAATYRVAAADVGHSLTCVVTATNAKGSTVAPPTNAIAIP